MATLRFKNMVDGFDNSIWFYITNEESEIFPFIEGELVWIDLILWNLQHVNEKEVNWTVELVPDGVDHDRILLVKAVRVRDNIIQPFRFEADTRNSLKGHTIAEDGPIFPFDEFQKIKMQLRVAYIERFLDQHPQGDKATWTASLIPAGKIVNDTIICDVERANG